MTGRPAFFIALQVRPCQNLDMPLPVAINYLDSTSTEQSAIVQAKKDSGYRPDPTYYPTMKVVRCKVCETVGVAEFVGGFNLKAGDNLMAGRPIRGLCFRCRKETELVPLEPHLKKEEAGVIHLYRIQQTLDEMVKRGESPGPSGIIWPIARVLDRERKRRELEGKSAGVV